MFKFVPPKKNKGFTLIELLVVISIIGLLSSVVLASVNSARDKATAAKLVSEMKALQNAIEMYRADNNGDVPIDESGMWYSDYNGEGYLDDLSDYLVPKYISRIPHSPDFPHNGTDRYISYVLQNTYYGEEDEIDDRLNCGSNRFDNYAIVYYDLDHYENDNVVSRFPLNLPQLNDYGGVYFGTYCISG
jgi:type II secretion system protein G